MTDPRKAAGEWANNLFATGEYRIEDAWLAGYAAAEQRWRSPEEEPCEGQLCVVEIFNRIITLLELRTYREHLGFGEIKTNVEFGRWLPITLPEGEA